MIEETHQQATRVLNDPEQFTRIDEHTRALLGAYYYALQNVADTLERLNQTTRTCPGPYWRSWISVKERIDKTLAVKAEGAQRKRRKPNLECKSKLPTFARAEYGPAREDDGERLICDACSQQLRKDRREGFLK